MTKLAAPTVATRTRQMPVIDPTDAVVKAIWADVREVRSTPSTAHDTVAFDTTSNPMSNVASTVPASSPAPDQVKVMPSSAALPSGQPATLLGLREVPAEMAANLHASADRLLASFDEVQMQDIAGAAGVARSSLYYYFANKDDVLAFLLRAVLHELTTATSKAAAGPGTPPERLFAVIRAQLVLLNEHPAASQQLFANLGRAGQLPDIAAQVNQGFEVPVRALLAEGAADGTLRKLADDDLGATALFGAVLVMGLRALVVDGYIDVDRVMAMIGPMFWHGIAPPDPT